MVTTENDTREKAMLPTAALGPHRDSRCRDLEGVRWTTRGVEKENALFVATSQEKSTYARAVTFVSHSEESSERTVSTQGSTPKQVC